MSRMDKIKPHGRMCWDLLRIPLSKIPKFSLRVAIALAALTVSTTSTGSQAPRDNFMTTWLRILFNRLAVKVETVLYSHMAKQVLVSNNPSQSPYHPITGDTSFHFYSSSHKIEPTQGKTHTMHGIIMAAGKDLFAMRDLNVIVSDEHGITPPTPSHSVTSVRISCMELYNEELRDLLCTATTTLSIQEDRHDNVQIRGLTERTVDTIDELMAVIQIAEENRTVGSTAMNERSSRSHTIFRLTYEKKETTTTTAGVTNFAPTSNEREERENDHSHSSNHRSKVMTTLSTLNLVDLAGSESVRVTGAVGERQKEGGKINQR